MRGSKRLLQKSTVSQSCKQDCPDFAERMKRKALRGRSEAHIPPYVTEAEARRQHSDAPLCNSRQSRLLQKSTVSQSCLQDCLDFAERMKRKALRVKSEAHIPPYVTEAASRKQHSDASLCNSLSKTRLLALTLTASLLLSCGSRRHRSSAESLEQSQLHSELAVRDATQRNRDSSLEEWELLLVDTIMPPGEVARLTGDSLLGARWPEQSTVRYLRARRRVVQERDSVAQRRTTLERVAQQQSERQQEVVTKQQSTGRITYWIIFGWLLLMVAATLVWRIKETVAKVNSLTTLRARLSRLCRKDEAQGAEGEA